MKLATPYKAVIRRNTQQPAIFKNKWLEKLTYTSPWFIVGMYAVLTVLSLGYYSTTLHPETSIARIALVYLVGLASWSLGEYVLHRFVYHSIRDASYDRGIQRLFHGIHHEYPHDTRRIVLPVIPSLAFAAIIFGFIYGLLHLSTGNGDAAFVFVPGFVNGYLAYMVVHYAVHTIPSPSKYNYWWRHHNLHHFQQHDRAFGVTSPLWDYIFRTMPEKGRKTIVES